MQFAYYSPEKDQAFFLPKGRISFVENGLLMDWSASGFSFRFSGTGAVLSFAPYRGDMAAVYVRTYLDGAEATYAIRDGSEFVILSAEPGEHTVTFLRLSEGGIPLICTELCIRAASGGPAPALLAPPAPLDRRIVFYGDSITCGYGNHGNPDGGFHPAEEDPTRSYAGLTAARLHAEAELVSISGQGIVRDCGGGIGVPIPVFYRWQSRSMKTPCSFDVQPDVIVINAGTNDCGGGVTKEEFYEGAADFLRGLRHFCPNAPIVWFYGLMGLYYDDVLRKVTADLGDELGNLTYLPVRPICPENGEVGAHGHPSVEGASFGAGVLTETLRRLLGW